MDIVKQTVQLQYDRYSTAIYFFNNLVDQKKHFRKDTLFLCVWFAFLCLPVIGKTVIQPPTEGPYMPTPQPVFGLEGIVRLACGDSSGRPWGNSW